MSRMVLFWSWEECWRCRCKVARVMPLSNTLHGTSFFNRIDKNVLQPFQEVITVSQPALLGHPLVWLYPLLRLGTVVAQRHLWASESAALVSALHALQTAATEGRRWWGGKKWEHVYQWKYTDSTKTLWLHYSGMREVCIGLVPTHAILMEEASPCNWRPELNQHSFFTVNSHMPAELGMEIWVHVKTQGGPW